jgi:hypothetical protein
VRSDRNAEPRRRKDAKDEKEKLAENIFGSLDDQS